MKYKNISKLLPLCLLFSITACNGLTAIEASFLNEKVEIVISHDKAGLAKTVKRVLKELEPYADPRKVGEILNKYRNCFDDATRNEFCFTGDLDLYRMLDILLEDENDFDYSPHDNGLTSLWREAIFQNTLLDYDVHYQKSEELLPSSANFVFGGSQKEPRLFYTGDFTFDLRPVIESYALQKIRDYLGTDLWNGRANNYIVKTSPNNMYVCSENEPRSVSLNGPYGKRVIINGLRDAYVTMVSSMDSQVTIGDTTVSTKYIDYTGPYVENDCVIYVTSKTYHYSMHDAVKSAAKAISVLKHGCYSFDYEESQYGMYAIIFKDGVISHCSSYLDVQYDGVSFGSGKMNW